MAQVVGIYSRMQNLGIEHWDVLYLFLLDYIFDCPVRSAGRVKAVMQFEVEIMVSEIRNSNFLGHIVILTFLFPTPNETARERGSGVFSVSRQRNPPKSTQIYYSVLRITWNSCIFIVNLLVLGSFKPSMTAHFDYVLINFLRVTVILRDLKCRSQRCRKTIASGVVAVQLR